MPQPVPIIDMHVHIIGNGSNGSGCKLKLRSPYHKLLAQIILREYGLPQSALDGDLDNLYLEKILSFLEQSSLTHLVLLAHERVYSRDGTSIEDFGSLYVPNDHILNLAKKYPKILAGVSIHPARNDAFDELQKCLDSGAVLMKCLPNCQNIDCSDAKYKRFWEKMAEAGLPLLAHTGGELSVPVYNKAYSDPETLKLPLECGVNVVAAHCGTSSLPFERNYLATFRTMLLKYPNLYGDISGMQTPFRSKHFKTILADPLLRSRVVHGSDLPIPISPTWARAWGLLSKADAKRAKQVKNPLEADMIIKRGMGFGDEIFSRVASILRIRE